MRELDLNTRDRLLHTLTHATGTVPPPGAGVWSAPVEDPAAIQRALVEAVEERTVVVTGALDRRLVLIEHDDATTWSAADLSGQPHDTRPWPAWTANHLHLASPGKWLSPATITTEGRRRLLRPRVLLASLYHPENFPLPRFPLAISDLARAARASLLGTVELLDMQLGTRLDEILARVAAGEVDVLGISATFRQHDLLTTLLDEVDRLNVPVRVVAGGSLTVRNERLLLDRYPNLLIGRGAGEPTIADVLAHWHGDLALEDVRGIGYRDAARGEGTVSIRRVRRTGVVPNRAQTGIWPELDLLEPTFARHGVAQLEVSRGCTNYCSFCPRGHKGSWSGAPAEALPRMLRELRAVFDRHPEVSRTLYLVDEEFIGRGPDAVSRALAVADTLAEHGFAWETSCRVDQVVQLDHDRDWHLDRGEMWRGLVERRLRRCLFGVESGVTSILDRFNKETTSTQNALAIRTLTALGVPPRFTYITFDQLMTAEELRETYAFQGRTDLLLKPQPGLSVAEIVDGVRDEQWVADHASGRPFYTGISYPLVSMECLIGAAYTQQATAAGLTGQPDPVMGRVEARFADWRIGIASEWAQRWIDRNCALDYTLKSLEKVLDGPPHQLLRNTRTVLKHAAHQLLGNLLDAFDTTGDQHDLRVRCSAAAETLLGELRTELEPVLRDVVGALPDRHRDVLVREHERWLAATGWQLINVADPCGT